MFLYSSCFSLGIKLSNVQSFLDELCRRRCSRIYPLKLRGIHLTKNKVMRLSYFSALCSQKRGHWMWLLTGRLSQDFGAPNGLDQLEGSQFGYWWYFSPKYLFGSVRSSRNANLRSFVRSKFVNSSQSSSFWLWSLLGLSQVSLRSLSSLTHCSLTLLSRTDGA